MGQIGPHSALELGAALSSLPWGCLAFSPPASVSRHVHSHPTQSLASGPGTAMGPEGHESLPTDCQGPPKWSDMVLHMSLSKYKSLLCACHMFLPCPPVLSMCACPFHVHVCAVTCICYMSHVPVYNSLPCNTSLCVCMSLSCEHSLLCMYAPATLHALAMCKSQHVQGCARNGRDSNYPLLLTPWIGSLLPS